MRIVAFWVVVLMTAGATPAMAQGAAHGQDDEPTSGINVGLVKNLKFSGVLQAWYQAGDEGFGNTFRVRRSRLYLSGDLPAHTRFMVMVDPARALAINQQTVSVDGTTVVKSASVNQATRILLDAYIAMAVAPHFEVQAGQFKLPMDYEGSAPVQGMPLVERTLMVTDRARGGTFGDLRDMGVMVRGTFDNGVEFRAGVFNSLGSNQSEVDKDDHKAVAGRVAWRTPLRGLQVGAFAASDRDSESGTSHRKSGVDVRFTRGRLLLQGELAGGHDGALTRRAYYATAAWRVLPAVEVAGRLDVLEPDTRAGSDPANAAERDYVGGFTHRLSGDTVRWQAEYLRKTFGGGARPARDVFLASLQVTW